MVTLVCGPINSGKTTKMEEIYKSNLIGDGFVSLKIMAGSQVTGFDIMKLSTKETKSFIRRITQEPTNWIENCRLGPYTVSDTAIKWVTGEIENMIAQKKFPIFLDEIGVLEINKKCFFEILNKMYKSNGEIYISTRDENLEKIIKTFNIKNKKIIKTGARYA